MPYNYELIILGAGISGLGVAQAAAERCVTTLLLDASNPASATSDNTLRIIHGGFRYLQTLQFARVIRSLNDQTFVANNFPDATKPLPCLMPLKAFGLKSRIPVSAAALLYGAAMRVLSSPLKTPHIMSSSKLGVIAPQLKLKAPHGALCWHDVVMTNPGALAQKITAQIAAQGVAIRPQTIVTSVKPTSDGYIVTTDTGEEITARSVVNTLGPWLNTIEAPPTSAPQKPAWCLGFNITIKHQIHPTHAIAVESPDGRLFFAVPRGDYTAIGTWYTRCEAPGRNNLGKQPAIPERELLQFISAWNTAWPEQLLTLDQISSCDAGILPMRRENSNGPELYGAEIITSHNRYCEVMSTKYTTFRSQGLNVLKEIL